MGNRLPAMSLFSGPEDESKGLTWMRNKLLDKEGLTQIHQVNKENPITDLLLK